MKKVLALICLVCLSVSVFAACSGAPSNPEELVERYMAWGDGRAVESAIYLTVADHGDLEQYGLVRDRLEVKDLRGEDIEDEEQ